jgi:hypothetical protein
MRKRLRAHAVLAAVMTAVVATPNVAAYSTGNGNSLGAQGQERATQQCWRMIASQSDSGITAKGGDKANSPGPANCDHEFYP